MTDKRKLEGVHTIDAPAPEPKATRMPDQTWEVYETHGRIGHARFRGNPSDGGFKRGLHSIGSVSAPDIGEALSRANTRYGPDHVDYVKPVGHFPEERTGVSE